DEQAVHGTILAGGRAPVAGRAGTRGALRAALPGLARRVSLDRPARLLLLLRGVRAHRRLDVQSAREVAEGEQGDSVAAPSAVAELSVDVARLAAGPQRLQPSRPGLHRPRREQEGRRDPRVPAA